MCVSLCVGMQVSKDSLIEGIKERRGMGQLLQEMESVCVHVSVCVYVWVCVHIGGGGFGRSLLPSFRVSFFTHL